MVLSSAASAIPNPTDFLSARRVRSRDTSLNISESRQFSSKFLPPEVAPRAQESAKLDQAGTSVTGRQNDVERQSAGGEGLGVGLMELTRKDVARQVLASTPLPVKPVAPNAVTAGAGQPTGQTSAPAVNTQNPLKLASGKTVTNAYEAYWASQPPEVQSLMNCRNEAERWDVAHELADKGYAIDVPIMVWNWDPLATMVVRRNQGFTWVPSAKQDPVRVAPGITFGGLPSYDAKNPPAGAIAVSTTWAKGFEQTCPWLTAEDITSLQAS